MGTIPRYEVEKWWFLKCSGTPKEGYLEGRGYFYFDIYHAP